MRGLYHEIEREKQREKSVLRYADGSSHFISHLKLFSLCFFTVEPKVVNKIEGFLVEYRYFA